MRSGRTGIVVAGAMLVVVTCVAPAFAHHLPGPCDFHRRVGESTAHVSMRRIVCAVDRFGPVRGGATRAVCIARRESGLDPTATSPTGRYLGLFQHDRDLWPGRFETYTRRRWELSNRARNGRTNAIVTIRMVAAIGGWKAAGWPPKEC
jgi:hypothetical protein